MYFLCIVSNDTRILSKIIWLRSCQEFEINFFEFFKILVSFVELPFLVRPTRYNLRCVFFNSWKLCRILRINLTYVLHVTIYAKFMKIMYDSTKLPRVIKKIQKNVFQLLGSPLAILFYLQSIICYNNQSTYYYTIPIKPFKNDILNLKKIFSV